jgi:type I restriction enzyme, R subunit
VERLRVEAARRQVREESLTSIISDVARLPEFVKAKREKATFIDLCLDGRLRAATPLELRQLAIELAPEMRNRRALEHSFVELDLADLVAERGYISLGEGGEQVYVRDYRDRVERRILAILDEHPAINAIRAGKQVDDAQLIDLERTLHERLGADDIKLTQSNIKKAFNLSVDSFLELARYVLDIESLPNFESIVRRQFSEYVSTHPFTADQILFIGAVQQVLLQRRRFTEVDLYEEPLTRFGRGAAERLFTPHEIADLLQFVDRLAA